MFRLVEYFNTLNNGEGLTGPSCGVHYALPYGHGLVVGTDANGYKYAYGDADDSCIYAMMHPAGFDTVDLTTSITPSCGAFYYFATTVKFNNTPPTEENYATTFCIVACDKVLSTEVGRSFIFFVLQYDSDGFGTMKNGLYIRYRWGTDQLAWRIVDDFNLTDLYTIELKVYTDKFVLRVLQNNEEITNETHNYSEFDSTSTDTALQLKRIELRSYKTDNNVYYYYWEYGLYDIDCSEGESDKLYVDGTVVPNATIYFLDNDSSSGTYQKVIGTAITDADGSYTLPSGVSPPYIAFGTTPSGYGFCVKVDS